MEPVAVEAAGIAVTDNCAGCGERLAGNAVGGRLRCCDDRYWSEAVPTADDERGARQLGFPPMQTCERVSDGARMVLYRRPS